MQNITTKYFANGCVLGTLWVCSKGIYPLKQFPPFDSIDGLLKTLTDCMESSSETLTGTGDFAYELGALISITCISTVTIDDMLFTNEQTLPEEFIGDLTEEQEEGLIDEWVTV